MREQRDVTEPSASNERASLVWLELALVPTGVAGHFGLVIGVACKANAEQLQHEAPMWW
jgi:hypothetical protein